MNKTLQRFTVGLLALGLTSIAQAVEWETYESAPFNVSFDLPDTWDVEIDENTLVASPAEGGLSFVIVGYEDSGIGTEELFEEFVNNIGLDLEGEYEEVADFNGFHAFMGSGAADIGGQAVMIIAAALTMEEDNLVAYVFCHPDLIDENEDLMMEILTSIAPLQG